MSILYATPDAALEVDESFLAGLGVQRIVIPVPFLEAGGPVNAFAIEEAGGGFALFDSGIATDEGRAALEQGLADRRLSVANLTRIIVSHGHVDHYGNAQELSERSGAKVHVHRERPEEGVRRRPVAQAAGAELRLLPRPRGAARDAGVDAGGGGKEPPLRAAGRPGARRAARARAAAALRQPCARGAAPAGAHAGAGLPATRRAAAVLRRRPRAGARLAQPGARPHAGHGPREVPALSRT